jgi:hypothetical protein
MVRKKGLEEPSLFILFTKILFFNQMTRHL